MKLHATAHVTGVDRLIIGRVATRPVIGARDDVILLMRDSGFDRSGRAHV